MILRRSLSTDLVSNLSNDEYNEKKNLNITPTLELNLLLRASNTLDDVLVSCDGIRGGLKLVLNLEYRTIYVSMVENSYT